MFSVHIGGEEVRPGTPSKSVMPHVIAHLLQKCHKGATPPR